MMAGSRLIPNLLIFAVLAVGSGLLSYELNASAEPVLASHGPCSGNSEYWHVHWYRSTSQPEAYVYYDWYIINQSGATNYESKIHDKATAWTTGQDFVDFVPNDEDEYTPLDLVVNDFAFIGLGRVNQSSSSPNYCSTSSSHWNNVLIEYNSGDIEAETSNDWARSWIIAHELGHALGLGHHSSYQRIMYANLAFWTTSPTQGDFDQLSESGQYDPYDHIH